MLSTKKHRQINREEKGKCSPQWHHVVEVAVGTLIAYSLYRSYQPIVNLWENPRFHGSLQAAAGFPEASIGSAISFSTYGLAAPLGCALMALDHLTAGMRTVITGDHYETATTQLLQKTGLSEQNASFVNSGSA